MRKTHTILVSLKMNIKEILTVNRAIREKIVIDTQVGTAPIDEATLCLLGAVEAPHISLEDKVVIYGRVDRNIILISVGGKTYIIEYSQKGFADPIEPIVIIKHASKNYTIHVHGQYQHILKELLHDKKPTVLFAEDVVKYPAYYLESSEISDGLLRQLIILDETPYMFKEDKLKIMLTMAASVPADCSRRDLLGKKKERMKYWNKILDVMNI